MKTNLPRGPFGETALCDESGLEDHGEERERVQK